MRFRDASWLALGYVSGVGRDDTRPRGPSFLASCVQPVQWCHRLLATRLGQTDLAPEDRRCERLCSQCSRSRQGEGEAGAFWTMKCEFRCLIFRGFKVKIKGWLEHSSYTKVGVDLRLDFCYDGAGSPSGARSAENGCFIAQVVSKLTFALCCSWSIAVVNSHGGLTALAAPRHHGKWRQHSLWTDRWWCSRPLRI